MMYTIFALENSESEACISTTKTDNETVKNAAHDAYHKIGYIVAVETENDDGELSTERTLP